MFPQLNDKENDILRKAIAQITILIAAADGKIDDEETEWAKKLTEIRSFSHKASLQEFYDAVGNGFQSDLDVLIAEAKEKNIVDELLLRLSAVNAPLAKLPNKLSYTLYHSYLSFADHVARAAGGFLRFGSISKEEKKLIGLPSIAPIELVVEDEN